MKTLIAITGAGGMLGSSLRSHLESTGSKVLAPSRRELNISDETSVREYVEQFDIRSPDANPAWLSGLDTVYHLAAYVGGVKANSERLATFFHQNAQMGLNLLDACSRSRVPKVVSVLSTCVYPDTPYVTLPLTEDQLHLGPPHPSNFGYAYAKRMPHILCDHAFALAQAFSKFYAACRIGDEADDATRSSRLRLARITADQLATVLETLGLPVPDRM